MDGTETDEEDELYASVGRWLLPDLEVLGAKEQLREWARIGREWWVNNVDELRDVVCGDPRVVALKLTADDNSTELVTVIADALAAVKGLPPVVTLARLILLIGVDRFCAER